ncbi:SPOR domain-containing protein [Virgibacillus doumboii]|uniref:SPOR domain-containing protein n=1 Tax=Virgibacillus doumboii TaxID=2697503 RepID=UPI0013DF37DC|nr:SPOR domain-containing protein [Virgibacillus doumboii]
MAKDKKITVWMNGKKTKITRKDDFDESYPIKEFSKKDAAATLEDSNSNEVPAFVRSYSHDDENERFFGRKGRFSIFKPIIFASVSAIIIGSILGLFMLSMFVDIDNSLSQQDNNLPAMIDEEDNKKEEDENKESDSTAVSAVTMDATNAFVLQAGKFGNEANAKEMANTFNQSGFSVMVWTKDNYSYVFAGIANSKQLASQLTTEFSEQQLEVYVKEWTTESFELQLNDDEKKWLQSYKKQWNESLVAVSKEESISKEDWKNVIDSTPEKSDRLSGFTDFLKKELNNIGQAGKWQEQRILLNLWYQLHEKAAK